MEYVITQSGNGAVKVSGSTFIAGDEVSAPYDAARHAQALLHSIDSSLQAFGYGNTGAGAADNERANDALASDLRALAIGESIRLDSIDLERAE